MNKEDKKIEKIVDDMLSSLIEFKCQSCGWIGLNEELYKKRCPKCNGNVEEIRK